MDPSQVEKFWSLCNGCNDNEGASVNLDGEGTQ